MKRLETEISFFPFGVKRKCGNKKQRVREGKHVLNSKENKKRKKTQIDALLVCLTYRKTLKV